MQHRYLRLAEAEKYRSFFPEVLEGKEKRGKIFEKKHNLLQARTDFSRPDGFSCLVHSNRTAGKENVASTDTLELNDF